MNPRQLFPDDARLLLKIIEADIQANIDTLAFEMKTGETIARGRLKTLHDALTVISDAPTCSERTKQTANERIGELNRDLRETVARLDAIRRSVRDSVVTPEELAESLRTTWFAVVFPDEQMSDLEQLPMSAKRHFMEFVEKFLTGYVVLRRLDADQPEPPAINAA